jgi:hypothetical protein
MKCLHDCLLVAIVAVMHGADTGLHVAASPDSGIDPNRFEMPTTRDPLATVPPDVIIGLPREYGNAFRMETLA